MKFSRIALVKLLEAYPEEAAVINEHGTILAANRAWKEFGGQGGLAIPNSCERTNYLKECERAQKRGARGAATACAGIRRVLNGASDRFSCRFDLGSKIANQWYRLTASPFNLFKNRRWALILHVNITHERILAARYLRRSKTNAEFASVCAWCKLVAKDPTKWVSFEEYFSKTKGVRFSHGICPNCVANFTLEAPSRDFDDGAAPVCEHRPQSNHEAR